MNASDFFSKGIKDNLVNGISLREITLDKDFYCVTKGNNIEGDRKQGILSFLREIQKLIGSKNLKELNIKRIQFDEEFDANLDQRMFTISGIGYSDIKLHTGNIIGSVSYQGLSFNINCRFGDAFLVYMIASTSGFLELEDMGSFTKDDGANAWILIYYWKLKLKKAFALGIYKTYQAKHEELLSIRGSIDINAYIKKTYNDGRTLCHFKEHSYHNPVNDIISKAIKKVFRTKYFSLVNDIYDIKRAFDPFDSGPRRSLLTEASVINPYFASYKEVVDLSKMILNDELSNVELSDKKCSAFLFDVSLLFEHHIRKLLKESFELRPKNFCEYRLPNGVYDNALYPDVIIDHGNGRISIYDVKYKQLNTVHGVEREDRFQLTSYVASYMNDHEVIACGVVYPVTESQHIWKLKTDQYLNVGGKAIPFSVVPYHVMPEARSQYEADKKFLDIFGRSPSGPDH